MNKAESIKNSPWFSLQPDTPIKLCQLITIESCDEVINGTRYLSKEVHKIAESIINYPGVYCSNGGIVNRYSLKDSWKYRNNYWKNRSIEDMNVQISVNGRFFEVNNSNLEGNKLKIRNDLWLEII